MLIGLAQKFIFIANLKTASTAIEKTLGPTAEIALVESQFGKHLPLCLVEDRFSWVFDVSRTSDFFVFGVIREPADFLISQFNSHSHPKFKGKSTLYSGDIDFDCFLNEWIKANPEQVVPQFVRFLTADGRVGANYLISYSALADGLKRVAAALDTPALNALERLNVSPLRMTREALSRRQLAWIKRHFAEDYRFMERFCDRVLTADERRTTGRVYGRMAWEIFATPMRQETPNGKRC